MIKQARILKGLTQKELADKVGICRSYMSRIEKREPLSFEVRTEHIHKIATELGICPLELATHLCNVCEACELKKDKHTKCFYCKTE